MSAVFTYYRERKARESESRPKGWGNDINKSLTEVETIPCLGGESLEARR